MALLLPLDETTVEQAIESVETQRAPGMADLRADRCTRTRRLPADTETQRFWMRSGGRAMFTLDASVHINHQCYRA